MTRDEIADMLATALDAVPTCVIITDGCVVLFANAPARRLFKCEDRFMLEGRSMLDIVHPDGHDAMKLRCEILMKSSQSLRRLPVKLVALDGSAFNQFVEATPVECRGRRVVMFTSER